jgi:hypothetical protein
MQVPAIADSGANGNAIYSLTKPVRAYGTAVKKTLFIGVPIPSCTAFFSCVGYFHITPNATVVIVSNHSLPSSIVTLPNSRLDFGSSGSR